MRTFYEATFRIKAGNNYLSLTDVHAVLRGEESERFALIEAINAPIEEAVPWRALHIANIGTRYDMPEESSALLVLVEYDLEPYVLHKNAMREPTERMFFYLDEGKLKIGGFDIEEDLLSPEDFVCYFEKARNIKRDLLGKLYEYPSGRIAITILPREEMALKLLAQ